MPRIEADRIHPAARRTQGVGCRMASRIGMAREDPRGKEVDAGTACRAIELLDPKEVEDVGLGASFELGLVVGAEGFGHVALDAFESLQDGFAVVDGKRVANQEVRDRIDVAANRVGTELERFAQGGAAAHERIEHHSVFQPGVSVEGVEHVGSRRRERTKNDGSKNRSQAMCPPLVDVVDRTVDLLAPAF